MSDNGQWRNRIIESGEIKARELVSRVNHLRIHPQAQIEALEAILGDVGSVGPIIISHRSGLVIDGRARVERGAQTDESLPYVRVDLSEDEERKVLATFDYITGMAEFDTAQMESLLASIEDDSGIAGLLEGIAEDLSLDFGEELPEDPGPQIDRAAELQEKWQTERGQLWEIGKHRLLCGDSTNAEDVARLMGGEKAQLLATDPPYGVDFKGQKYNPRAKDWDGIVGDKRQGSELYEWCREWLAIWLQHVSEGVAAYVWAASMAEGARVADAIRDSGVHIQSQIVWVKTALVLGQADYHWRHEICWYGFFKGKQHAWYGRRDKTTVWEFKQDAHSSYLHPHQKPVDLWLLPIEHHTLQNEICIDPFVGGGSSMAAAEQTGRVCYGMEIEPKYIAVTLERMAGMGLEPRLVRS